MLPLELSLNELLAEVPDSVTVMEAEKGGAVLRITADKPTSRLRVPIGKLLGVERFTLCHRYEPFWMTPKVGTQAHEIPPETQYLLAKRESDYLLMIPLIDGVFRASLEGDAEDWLYLVAESGDDAIVTDQVVGLYLHTGEDAFALLRDGAKAVVDYLGKGRLRNEKPLPEFIDLFGWCTWDAFYGEVSQEKVREGLESFQAGGITPKYLILDDGWQSVKPFPTGERRLTSFAANMKFPGDLKPTVTMAKQEFGIETFLVWHAVGGYWGGVDSDALPGYGVRAQARQYSTGIHHHVPGIENWFGTACGVVPAEHIYRFYQDYHRHLRQQGVDGVKVDNQASLEGVAQGQGGRVALMQAYREALEGSTQVHFQGNLINCMSLANEMLFYTPNSTLTRSFTDFWPDKPESHGLHLYANAQNSAFWGELIHPDWDMFQSGHEMGAYHAAGRAVSGSPVYVSDKPGVHNFDVLRKLVLPDGRILRYREPGRPTLDCLFQDPTQDDVLLKVWNGEAGHGIVGVFHARYGEGVGAISGVVRPSDVSSLKTDSPTNKMYLVYSHYGQEMRHLQWDEAWEITLEPLTADVFTVIPYSPDSEVVPVGLTTLFNAPLAVFYCRYLSSEAGYEVGMRCGEGKLTLWSSRRPQRVYRFDGEGNEHDIPDVTYDSTTGKLEILLSSEQEMVQEMLRIVL